MVRVGMKVQENKSKRPREISHQEYLRQDMGNEQHGPQVDRGRPACWSAEH